MDQYTIANGKTIFLDTKTNEVETFDHNLCDMIVGVSSKPKDTQGLLKKLKDNAQNQLILLRIKCLVSIYMIKKIFIKVHTWIF